ncbi:hypothetical protein SAMN04488102_101379 [Alkalibacterium subtropicum]|uniref:Uncharacterized protein n=1 Tax=Alkalibacterium subtropicum TaxID=753702 RepID=A0A1I1EWX7_9LACT|nr:hypothetical protein [Alkalibacterium subtropicum]SFB91162.1 hypothetical protein SAMN04488102_101379 [Alkalibacterium subtropicum]
MDEWTELYNKKVNNVIHRGSISVHIKDNVIIAQVYDQITMVVRPTEEDAIIAATALVLMYKSLDEIL